MSLLLCYFQKSGHSEMAELETVIHSPSRTHMVEEEPTPISCPMTSTCMLRHVLTHRHTYLKELFEKRR